jgi:hypothetical protein
MKDVIDFKDMVQGNLISFVEDRFGCPNSALALRGGWTQVPSGVYFDTNEFSISVWIHPSYGYWSRIIDFGNGESNDNIVLGFSDTSLNIFLEIWSGSFKKMHIVSSQPLITYQWHFIAATFNGTNGRIFFNDTLTTTDSFHSGYSLSTNLSRTNCYIGKSNWPADGYLNSFLDDLRFYNKSLTHEEIIQNFQNEKGSIFFLKKYKVIKNFF